MELNQSIYPIDPTSLIFVYHHRPDVVVLKLYERGIDVFVCDGDVDDLTGPMPQPGHYRTCQRRGLIQMGSASVGRLTVDLSTP